MSSSSSIFTEALSLSTCTNVLEQYQQYNLGYGFSGIPHLDQPTSTKYFPLRKCWRALSDELIELLKKELWSFLDFNSEAICGGKDGHIEVKNNFRLYESEYGIVKPHRDLPMCGDDTHTCLIYLTDSFVGGNLTVEDEHDLNPITYVPKIGYCIIYPKHIIHYTDEQYDGNKIILLSDLRITRAIAPLVVSTAAATVAVVAAAAAMVVDNTIVVPLVVVAAAVVTAVVVDI